MRLGRFIAGAVLVTLGSPAAPSAAGDGECIPLVINMTPDGSDDASRTCGAAIRRALRGAVGDFDALGESRLRRRVVSAGDESAAESDFLTWDRAALDQVARDMYYTGGSLILFDCRPTEQLFRGMVVPQGRGSIQIRLGGELMTEETAVMAMGELVRYQAVGWDP